MAAALEEAGVPREAIATRSRGEEQATQTADALVYSRDLRVDVTLGVP